MVAKPGTLKKYGSRWCLAWLGLSEDLSRSVVLMLGLAELIGAFTFKVYKMVLGRTVNPQVAVGSLLHPEI